MRITVLGATGGTGQHLVRQALEAGHHVTAVVRDAARLDRHARLEAVVADVMDPVAIEPAVKGQDAVVSALVPRPGDDSPVCAGGARSVITAMHAAGARRLVVDWTIMRPPRLTDGRRRAYRTSIDVNVRGGIMISRADLADAILGVLADPRTVQHTVSLGY